MIFTFTQHPILHLLNNHFGLFTGVQKVVVVFKEDKNSRVISIVKDENKIDRLDITNFQSEINKMRADSTPYNWFDEDSLPFQIRQAGIFQKEIFDELNKTILLLKTPSIYEDGLNDLLFIYFNKALNNFGLSANKENKLTPENKPLIARMLYNSINSIISDAKINKDALENSLNKNTHNIIQSLNTERTKHQVLQERFERTFAKLTKSLFHKYLENSNLQINLSKSAIEKLIDFNGDNNELERVIKNTSDYIKTIYSSDTPEIINIEDYFIDTSINLSKTNNDQSNNRYSKTIHLLDSLNEAVQRVADMNLNPTGINVGKAMTKRISAPAISDALKNHRSKILSLIDLYPNRWRELKQYFKPIQNIILLKNEHKNIS